jgi:hypothetical protein
MITTGIWQQIALAQTASINWNAPINISRSPNMTSTDPFVVGDPAGLVHLFWAEKVSDAPGNVPDTVMYAIWDGRNWSQPIDIHYSPPSHGNQVVAFPQAVIDGNGIIHLIWLTQPNFPNYSLFYSQSHSNETMTPNGWSSPVAIAEDLTGTNYALDIKVDSQQHLHVIYARVPAGDAPPELRATAYIRSTDAGITWSDSIDIYTVSVPSNGTSNTRLLVDEAGNVFASWSEWNRSGNGQAIGFARSMDNGLTWDAPINLTVRAGGEYERDWNNMAHLGNNTIVTFWEGGWRAYRHAQYSFDNGRTWTEPVDIFPGLIGENGFVEFARDGDGNLHLFYAQRTREGNMLRSGEGLWHSIWEGGTRWRDPISSGGNTGYLNPKVAIINGNNVVATWYTSPEFEIWVMTGSIIGVTQTPPRPWERVALEPETTSVPTYEISPFTPTPEQSDPVFDTGPISRYSNGHPGVAIMLGIFPSIIFVGIILMIIKLRQR